MRGGNSLMDRMMDREEDEDAPPQTPLFQLEEQNVKNVDTITLVNSTGGPRIAARLEKRRGSTTN